RLRPIGGGAGGRRPAGPAGARSAGGSDRRPRAAGAMSITHVFFDVGGVLGTNGWDQHHRAAAADAFGLDAAELHKRHEEAVTVWETGGMSLDQYLDHTVFHRARPFSREDFRAFMLSQSVAFPETIAVARDLARTGRYRMMTINNESAELNAYRLHVFGLRDIFDAFFTSCPVGPDGGQQVAAAGPGGAGGGGLRRQFRSGPGARAALREGRARPRRRVQARHRATRRVGDGAVRRGRGEHDRAARAPSHPRGH